MAIRGNQPSEWQALDYLTSVFQRAVAHAGFSPTVLGLNRHGSYIWEATFQEHLNHYITLGFTPTEGPAGPGVPAKELDIYIGADNGRRFHRSHLDAANLTAGGSLTLEEALIAAARSARAFTESDLDEEFIVPRMPGSRPLPMPS